MRFDAEHEPLVADFGVSSAKRFPPRCVTPRPLREDHSSSANKSLRRRAPTFGCALRRELSQTLPPRCVTPRPLREDSFLQREQSCDWNRTIFRVTLGLVIGGRWCNFVLRQRKVRTPKGSMPRESGGIWGASPK